MTRIAARKSTTRAKGATLPRPLPFIRCIGWSALRGSLSSAGPSASHGGNWLGVFLGLLEHHIFAAAAAQREFAVAGRIGGP